MSLQLKFWGVRGSLPSAPSPQKRSQAVEDVLRQFFSSGFREPAQISQFIESLEVAVLGGYGVATTCVEIQSAHQQLIIDGGSGIRNLSESLSKGKTKFSAGPYHIFMTHFHWDHVIGLPFFAPHFLPGHEIHYYGVQAELEKLIRGLFQKPYFPVPFEALSAKIHFHVLEPRKACKIGDITITPYQLDHPDPCWGLRVEAGGKVYSHCVDTEGTRVSREEMGADLPLYQGTDLMYFDAQYTFPELAEKANWGHSAAQVGLDIAFREKIKKVLFTHHDPGADAHQVQELKRQTAEYYDSRLKKAQQNKESLSPIDWNFVHEGFEIKL